MLDMLVMGCTLSNRGHITEKWAREPPCATPNASTHALPAQLLIEIGAPLGALPVAAEGRWDWQRPFPPGISGSLGMSVPASRPRVSQEFPRVSPGFPQVSLKSAWGLLATAPGVLELLGTSWGGRLGILKMSPNFPGIPWGSRPAVLPPLNVAALPLHRNCARRSWVHTALPGHFGRSVPWRHARQSTTSLL